MISFPVSSQASLLWWQKHQSRVRLCAVVFLVAYLLLFLADVLWRLVPAPELPPVTVKSASVNSPNRKSDGGIDITKLQALHLFGKEKVVVQEEVASVITDAPETSLNLTLTGVVSSTNVDRGAAIILHKGTQVTYGIGEKIEGTNATLRHVLADRIIIRNSGRDETLMLDGIDFKAPGRSNVNAASASVATARRSASPPVSPVNKEMATAAQNLRTTPENFTDYISISPQNQDGTLIGYQIKPGKDPSLFTAAGLQNDDIVVQINGMDLTDPQQAMDAMSEMRSAQSIELTVMRDGTYATIYLDMPSSGEVE